MTWIHSSVQLKLEYNVEQHVLGEFDDEEQEKKEEKEKKGKKE